MRAGLLVTISVSNKVTRGTEHRHICASGFWCKGSKVFLMLKGISSPTTESLAYSPEFLLTSEETHLSVCLFSPDLILGEASPMFTLSPSDP